MRNLIISALLISLVGCAQSSAKHTLRKSKTAHAESTSHVLVFRNTPSWNRQQTFEDVLDELGIWFVVKPSSEMATTNLAKYDFVIIPGAQWKTGYYLEFAGNQSVFENYVKNGGTLIVEMNGAEREGMILPGGVAIKKNPAFNNLITFTDHPIFAPLKGKPMISAHYASHGYLTSVPSGSFVLAVELTQNQTTPDMSKPTFVEYSYGAGRVIAGAQCFHDQDQSGRGPLMATLLKYAAVQQWVTTDLTDAVIGSN